MFFLTLIILKSPWYRPLLFEPLSLYSGAVYYNLPLSFGLF